MYKFNQELDINDLLDGRKILYISKKISYNREFISKILRGKQTCSYERAEQLVKACQPNKKVSDYFIKVKKEG